MSKKDFSNIGNDAFNTFLGGANSVPVQPVSTPVAKKTSEGKKGRPRTAVDNNDHIRVNGANKKDNYTITLKIDADVEDYLKNILWINRKTRNEFINDLIRADMIKRLGLKEDAKYSEIQKAWDNYKDVNNI